VEVEGKWMFAQLDREGATVHPNGLSPELLNLVFELIRLEKLLASPVEVKATEVQQEEEFMRQLMVEYEREMAREHREPQE
jgi:hypothetical protein